LGTIATAKPNVVVRIRGRIIQIQRESTRVSPIVPIAATNKAALLITIQPIPIEEY